MKLKEFLKANDMTIARLSRRSNITRQTIYNIINGRVNPDTFTLKQLAYGLEITLEQLEQMI